MIARYRWYSGMRVPVDQRDKFLRDVAARLASEPSDDAVVQALNVVMDRRRAVSGR